MKKKTMSWLMLLGAAGLGIFLYKRSQKKEEEKAEAKAVVKAVVAAKNAAAPEAQSNYVEIGHWG